MFSFDFWNIQSPQDHSETQWFATSFRRTQRNGFLSERMQIKTSKRKIQMRQRLEEAPCKLLVFLPSRVEGHTQLSQQHLVKTLSWCHCISSAPLSKISWLYFMFMWVSFWALFCFIDLSVQYHTVLITVTSQSILKLNDVKPPTLFLLILSYLFLVFCLFIYSLESVCWYPQKYLVDILIYIALNVQSSWIKQTSWQYWMIIVMDIENFSS